MSNLTRFYQHVDKMDQLHHKKQTPPRPHTPSPISTSTPTTPYTPTSTPIRKTTGTTGTPGTEKTLKRSSSFQLLNHGLNNGLNHRLTHGFTPGRSPVVQSSKPSPRQSLSTQSTSAQASASSFKGTQHTHVTPKNISRPPGPLVKKSTMASSTTASSATAPPSSPPLLPLLHTYQYIMTTITHPTWGNTVNPLQSRLFHTRGQPLSLQHPPLVHFPVLTCPLADISLKGTIELTYFPLREEDALQSIAPRGVTLWHFICYLSLTANADRKTGGTMVCQWLHNHTHQLSAKRCLAEQQGVVMEMQMFKNQQLLQLTTKDKESIDIQKEVRDWQYLDFHVSHLSQEPSQTLFFLAKVEITTLACLFGKNVKV
jgi:hypothetical protein